MKKLLIIFFVITLNTAWAQLQPLSNIGANSLSFLNPAIANITVNPQGTDENTATDFIIFSIPSAGVWVIDWCLRGFNNVLYGGISSILTDNLDNVLSNPTMIAYSSVSTGTYSSGTGRVVVTTTTAATYKVRVFSVGAPYGGNVTSDTVYGVSWVSALKVNN